MSGSLQRGTPKAGSVLRTARGKCTRELSPETRSEGSRRDRLSAVNGPEGDESRQGFVQAEWNRGNTPSLQRELRRLFYLGGGTDVLDSTLERDAGSHPGGYSSRV
jgi:hypothetical protein